MTTVDFEVIEASGLTERVFARNTGGIVTLTFPTTLHPDQMAIVLNRLKIDCQCKAAVGLKPGFYYGSIYGTLDTRQATNKATVMAWLHRADDSPQAIALRADLERQTKAQTTAR